MTLVVCVDTGGRFIPPFFIFRRVNFDQRLMLNAPSEAAAIAKQNGWLDCQPFCLADGICEASSPSSDSPVTLISDDHNIHNNIQVLSLARQVNAHLLCTPPNQDHKYRLYRELP